MSKIDKKYSGFLTFLIVPHLLTLKNKYIDLEYFANVILNITLFCRRLGNFVKLVDQMIVEHMFHVTKSQVTMFVSNVLVTGQSPLRDGFFKANLVFTKHGRYNLGFN